MGHRSPLACGRNTERPLPKLIGLGEPKQHLGMRLMEGHVLHPQATSSARRNAPAKPTSSKALSRAAFRCDFC